MAQLTITIPDEHIPRIRAALTIQTSTEMEEWLKEHIKDAVRDHEAMAALRDKTDAVNQETW